MIRLDLPGPDDLAEVIDSLLTAADACEPRAPRLAVKRRELAEAIGDAMDQLPAATHLPTTTGENDEPLP